MNRLTNPYNPPELSLDELRAYQAGQLSGPARNRVERLLLDNPFYADALDGLEALQQVGSSLQAHTYDLHEALQERVHESATTRRLMPLWVTSLVASVLLFISVAIYLIFRPATPPQRAGLAVPQPIEPGTILIDPADLGPVVDVPAMISPNTVRAGTPLTKVVVGHKAKQFPRPKKRVQHREPEVEGVIEAVTGGTELFPADKDIVTPPADPKVANWQRVNTERAFLR